MVYHIGREQSAFSILIKHSCNCAQGTQLHPELVSHSLSGGRKGTLSSRNLKKEKMLKTYILKHHISILFWIRTLLVSTPFLACFGSHCGTGLRACEWFLF